MRQLTSNLGARCVLTGNTMDDKTWKDIATRINKQVAIKLITFGKF
jgi:hypothetical protein